MPKIKITRDRVSLLGQDTWSQGRCWTSPDFPGKLDSGVTRENFALKDDDGGTLYEGVIWDHDGEAQDPWEFIMDWGMYMAGATEVWKIGSHDSELVIG